MILMEFMMKLPFRPYRPLTQPLMHHIAHSYWRLFQMGDKDSV